MKYIVAISTLLLMTCCHVAWGSNVGGTRQNIVHDDSDGGYTEILLAIDENVAEDLSLLDRIKVGSVAITMSFVVGFNGYSSS